MISTCTKIHFMTPIIDLHSHSICSDGQYTPLEVIQKAIKVGVKYLAITDHDTFHSYFYILNHMEQLKEILKEVQNFTYIPGAELSVVSAVCGGKQHLCVYFPQLSISSENIQNYVPDKHFYDVLINVEQQMKNIRVARIDRAKQILENLSNTFGLIKLSLQEFCQINNINMETHASESVVGRPMIASYLVKKGYCKSIQDAFSTFLSDSSPAVVAIPPVCMEDKIKEFANLNAITVIAHPFTWKKDKQILISELNAAVQAGLHGVEKYHCHQGVLDEEKLGYFDPGLVFSIGSDFHGEKVVPDVELGNLPMNAIMTADEKGRLLELLGLTN